MSDNQDWFEKPDVSENTLKNLAELCDKAFDLRSQIDQEQALVDEKKKALMEMQAQIQATLEEAGLESFKANSGTAYIQERTSFKIPVNPEEREAFFKYLKDKGAFDSLITVNYQTLNSFCKVELENALKEGDVNHKIPGIGEPTIFKEIRLRKGSK